MKKILVTGANGQLASCIKKAASEQLGQSFMFVTRQELDITDAASVQAYFNSHHFDYCVNTAAYTNVEKAEQDVGRAFEINAEGAKNVAKACEDHETTMIQISTDYVFDGNKNDPYLETDLTNPINVYGASKLQGEEYVKQYCKAHYVIRTSWLYSAYGHNFLNTMVKLAKAGTALTITTEQTGTPTNANDLAQLIFRIIEGNTEAYGCYHFSNKGSATWFDFAREILTRHSQLNTSNLAKTDHYRTFAKRPTYSVLNTNKVERTFTIATKDWRERLQPVIAFLETT